MKLKNLPFEHFKKSYNMLDKVVLSLENGETFIIYDDMDFEFNDNKRRIDFWRHGKFSYVKYNDIVSVSGELV